MSSTITANQNSADYITTKDAASGACLTYAFACDGGGRNYHRHSKQFTNALRELRGSESLSQRFGESFEAMLSVAESLAREEEQWSGDYEGLCIHASAQGADLIRLPYAPPQESFVGERFRFRPAADALPLRMEMLVLHLSFKHPELFLYDGQKAEVYGDIELPESVYAFSETEVLDPGQRAHVRKAKNMPGPSMVRHGMAATKSPRELNEPVFLQQVSHALQDLEESRSLPLVVVGDEKLVVEFEKVHEQPSGRQFRADRQNAHPDVLEIERLCRELAIKIQRDAKAEVLKKLKESDPSSELYNHNLKEVFEAAQQARIQFCAVAADEHAWCRYDENGALSSAKPEDEGAVEALDRIYVETVLKGGEVAVVPGSKMPEGRKVIAVFKW